MEKKHNVVVWFEIPVADMERAKKFYEKIFNTELHRETIGEIDMAWFPGTENAPGTSGSLVKGTDYIPSSDGILIYFAPPSGDLAEDLKLISRAGGTILMEKTMISPEVGYMGIFLDSEGNRVALHSKQ